MLVVAAPTERRCVDMGRPGCWNRAKRHDYPAIQPNPTPRAREYLFLWFYFWYL